MHPLAYAIGIKQAADAATHGKRVGFILRNILIGTNKHAISSLRTKYGPIVQHSGYLQDKLMGYALAIYDTQDTVLANCALDFALAYVN